MPKFLITHASLGSGHARAAAALAEAFGQLDTAQVQVEDVLTYVSPVLQKMLSSAYLQTSERGPRLYQSAFEASDKGDIEDAFSFNRIMGIIGSPFIKEYDEMVEAAAPDAIICTMQLPLQLLTYRQQAGRAMPPIYVVVTDFMAHSTWFAPNVSGYFVPSAFTRRTMVQRGVPAAHIHVTGIPVTLEVLCPKPMDEMRQRHAIAPERPLIALFAGGLAPDRVRLIVEQLLESEFSATLAVVAGRNERLEAALADLEDGPHMRLLKLGLIDYVDDLVAASDLVITKAGGLIVSEVLARGTPLVIIDPILGQEEWNADFIAASGAGIQVRLAEMVPTAALYLLSQQPLFTTMRRQAEKIGRPRAALDIAEHVLAGYAMGG